jgi:hypothetical protein
MQHPFAFILNLSPRANPSSHSKLILPLANPSLPSKPILSLLLSTYVITALLGSRCKMQHPFAFILNLSPLADPSSHSKLILPLANPSLPSKPILSLLLSTYVITPLLGSRCKMQHPIASILNLFS